MRILDTSAVIPDYQTWTVSVEALTTAQPRRLAVRLGREELVRGGAVLAVIPGASENDSHSSEPLLIIHLLNLSC